MKKINVVNDETSLDQNFFNTLQSNVEDVFNGEEPMGSIIVDDVVSKNLLPISESETITLSKKIEFDEPLQAGKYYLSVESLTTNGTVGKYLFQFNPTDGSDGYYPLLTDTIYSRSLDLPKECKSVNIYSQQDWATSRDITTTFNKLMLIKGDVKSDYTPYKKFGYNSQESMGKIVVDDIECKNLFNKDTHIFNSGDASITILDTGVRLTAKTTGGNQYVSYIVGTSTKLVGKTITLTCNMTHSNSNTTMARLCYLNSNGSYNSDLGSITSSGSLTKTIASSTAPYVGLLLYQNKDNTTTVGSYADYTNIQIELGDKATPYTPYKEFSNKETKSVSLWSGRTYESGSVLTLSKPLEIGKIYIIEFYGLSGMYKSCETFVYTGNRNIQINYYSTADNTGFRYRLTCEGNTITISNESVGTNNNTAITNIYEITNSYIETTSTQTASTMSLRPDTTEEGELDG